MSGLNMISTIFFRKPHKKLRSDSRWTEIYPSPEPTFLKKTFIRASKWVYSNIDNFFQGSTTGQTDQCDIAYYENDHSDGNTEVWDLNQGVMDIAIKDITRSFNCFVPNFIRRFATRTQQKLLLYFFTDNIIDVDYSGWNQRSFLFPSQVSDNKGKIIFTFQKMKEGIDVKILSINNWWKYLFHKLKLLLRLEHDEKTYYLLGNFAPKECGNKFDNQYNMIRGPDSPKLIPTFSFHKRN